MQIHINYGFNSSCNLRTQIESHINCESNKPSILSPCRSLALDISQTINKKWIRRGLNDTIPKTTNSIKISKPYNKNVEKQFKLSVSGVS